MTITLKVKSMTKNSDDRVCFTCRKVFDISEVVLINEGFECETCADENRTDYEKKKWGA